MTGIISITFSNLEKINFSPTVMTVKLKFYRNQQISIHFNNIEFVVGKFPNFLSILWCNCRRGTDTDKVVVIGITPPDRNPTRVPTSDRVYITDLKTNFHSRTDHCELFGITEFTEYSVNITTYKNYWLKTIQKVKVSRNTNYYGDGRTVHFVFPDPLDHTTTSIVSEPNKIRNPVPRFYLFLLLIQIYLGIDR